MRWIQCTIAGVIEKEKNNKHHAVVAIKEKQLSRNGFESEVITEVFIAGNDYDQGLHNTYRKIPKDVVVFVPFVNELREFNGKQQQQVRIVGVPTRFQEVTPSPQQTPKAVGQN